VSDINPVISQLVRGTTHCVQCGLCLPHCPTYAFYQDENESPRGRLLLMRLLATTTLDQPRARQHLSRCLHCSACESACPAGVKYRYLLDQTLFLQEQHRPTVTASLAWRVGAGLLTKPQWLRWAGWSLRFYQRAKLPILMRRSGLQKILKLSSIEQGLPQIPAIQHWAGHYPAVTEYRGQVLLFLGCVAQIFDQQTLRDAIFLLGQAGFAVTVPKQQNCCGALHFHHGDQSTGCRVAKQNIRAFTDHESAPILTTSSGCTAMLLDYGQQLSTTASQAFSARITDISDFLAREGKFTAQRFISTALKVAVHDPCTLRNVVGRACTPYQLLAGLPGVELVAIDHNAVCCGAAGIQHLTHPQLATGLRQPKLAAIDRIKPDVVVTSNIGCALHLAAGLRSAAAPIPLLHPISVLRSRLKPGSNPAA